MVVVDVALPKKVCGHLIGRRGQPTKTTIGDLAQSSLDSTIWWPTETYLYYSISLPSKQEIGKLTRSCMILLCANHPSGAACHQLERDIVE